MTSVSDDPTQTDPPEPGKDPQSEGASEVPPDQSTPEEATEVGTNAAAPDSNQPAEDDSPDDTADSDTPDAAEQNLDADRDQLADDDSPDDTASPETVVDPEETSEASDARPPGTLLADPDSYENHLRGMLGLLPNGVRAGRQLAGWIATAIAGLIAFITRFVGLNHPHTLVFDETYYVKGAYSLLHRGYEIEWGAAEDVNPLFINGDTSFLGTEADYVVHPPLGKWLMAIGQALFGSDNGVGWRFTTAILGVFAVMLIVRIALRLFRSPWLAGFAGIAMALDGMGITMSRTGILDNVLAFFVLFGFWAVLKDREWARGRLAHRVAHSPLRPHRSTFSPALLETEDPWGPRLTWRPWIVVAGVSLGAACGVKWSAIYAVAVFGILVFAWGMNARRIVGAPLWAGSGVFREGVPAFFALVPTALLTYIASWTSWFLNPNSWGRHWAETANPEELPLSWAPNAVNSLIRYHQHMWSFHHGLSESHPYQSQMWEWLAQARPVSFYWRGADEAAQTCGSTNCVEAITSIGNIAVWWLAIAALLLVIIAALRFTDWRAWAILAGYGAMWLPWLGYTKRTIFEFYAVAVLPFVVLALTYAVGFVAQMLPRASSLQERLDIGHRRAARTREDFGEIRGIRKRSRAFIARHFDDDELPARPYYPPIDGAEGAEGALGAKVGPGADGALGAKGALVADGALSANGGPDERAPDAEVGPGEAVGTSRVSATEAPYSGSAEPVAPTSGAVAHVWPSIADHPTASSGVAPATDPVAGDTPEADADEVTAVVPGTAEADEATAVVPAAAETDEATAVVPATAETDDIADATQRLITPDPRVSEVLAAADGSASIEWWEAPKPKRSSYVLVGGVTLLIVAVAAFWFPLWTGQSISRFFWDLHMWFPSWI